VPYNLLLLPLLGGFLFLHLTHYFRFGAQRLDGYRLLFQSAIAGIILSAIARILTLLIDLTLAGPFLGIFWMRFSPFDYSGISALALLLGPGAALIFNQFLDKEKSQDLEIDRHGNYLLKLLNRARKERRLVSITLDTRKWYVGWVIQGPNLDPQELYLQLLPFISGYRDKDSLEAQRSISYEQVLEQAGGDAEQFLITLPLKDVKIASLFDEDVYNSFFAEPEEGSGDGSPVAP
jgi:hypothetical protein